MSLDSRPDSRRRWAGDMCCESCGKKRDGLPTVGVASHRLGAGHAPDQKERYAGQGHEAVSSPGVLLCHPIFSFPTASGAVPGECTTSASRPQALLHNDRSTI